MEYLGVAILLVWSVFYTYAAIEQQKILNEKLH